MEMQPRTESPGSSVHPPSSEMDRAADAQSLEDALAGSAPSTDDTPTIISRMAPLPAATGPSPPGTNEDPATSIRGRRLAHFELIEPIGVGGMAAVLRARDTQLDRFVALKILPPEMASDAENVRRFHQEARSAAKLDHENIARVFYCGEDQRLHFIAFEFVEGENLRHILERRGRLPLGEAVHYMLQIAAGLAHASRRGVVHRDIKPSNIIITPNGRAKLVDMGLARSLEPRSEKDLTQSGVTLGTFDYISPEQALEPRDADVRSDIYSLGCTFYHVLTGRPAVPEGTAAKKLHHHQHIKPIDPRQYVPELPVEVVQILDRMMAKLPRERFQTPEELVHQLLMLARKLGTAPEVPEGVLSVEAAVPNPPTSRPLFWTVVATVSVVALVLALDQVPQANTPVPTPRDIRQPPTQDKDKDKGTLSTAKGSEVSPPEKPTENEPSVSRYETPNGEANPLRHLVQWLERHRDAPRVELLLAGEYDLSSLQNESKSGLLVRAKRVRIRPRDPGQKVTLRFSYEATSSEALVALTVQANESFLEGIRFLVDAHQSDIELTALSLQGGKHQVKRCEFIQAQPSSRLERRFASVHAKGDISKSRPELLLEDCAFLGCGTLIPSSDSSKEFPTLSRAEVGGQVAVVREGACRILAQNCVFGPHVTAFQFLGDVRDELGQLTVRQCSLLLAARRSAAFEFVPDAGGIVEVSSTLISRFPGEAEEGAVLIRAKDDRSEAITFRGQDNCYHDLDGFWTVQENWQRASWGDFRARILEGSNRDESSRLVLSYPWHAEAEEQRKLLEGEQYLAAFRPQARLSSIRRLGRSRTEVVGASKVLGEPWNEEWFLRTDERTAPPLPRFLIVDDEDNDSLNGVYPTLGGAIESARPGDTILIRHNGELEISPVVLGKQDLQDLTIKPARKFKPILTLGVTTELEPSFFRLHDGKLRLEGLEFRARPDKRELKAQSVLTLVGDGECVLRDCVVTLKQRSSEAVLAFATLVEAGKAMRLDMPPARTRDQGPRLVVENCLIRGEGDLLWAKTSRPLGLEIKDSLVALSGSVVNLEVTREGSLPPSAQQMKLQLNQATFYLGEPLLRLHTSKDPSFLVPLRCKSERCLFVPFTKGKSLIQLEGPEGEDKTLKAKFIWEGGQNGYGGYTHLLAQEHGDGMAAPMGMDKWKMLPGEDASSFGVKLKRRPAETTNFSQIDPGQFEPEDSIRDLGASSSKIPRPAR